VNIQLGTVTGYEYTTNRDSEREVVILQVSLSEDEDVQNIQLFCGHGETHIPPVDSVVVVVAITASYKIAIAVDDGLDPTELDEGERLSYSQDSDGVHRTEILQKANGDIEIKSIDNNEIACATQTMQNTGVIDIQNENGSINLNADGDVTINEGTDWAIQFTALKSAFDQLVSDINSLVSTFNAHQHNYKPGTGSPIPTVPTVPPTPGSSSSADMSGAKIESIKVP